MASHWYLYIILSYKGRETWGRSAITASQSYKVNTFIEAFELRGCGC